MKNPSLTLIGKDFFDYVVTIVPFIATYILKKHPCFQSKATHKHSSETGKCVPRREE